jgi:hypothetical protein
VSRKSAGTLAVKQHTLRLSSNPRNLSIKQHAVFIQFLIPGRANHVMGTKFQGRAAAIDN